MDEDAAPNQIDSSGGLEAALPLAIASMRVVEVKIAVVEVVDTAANPVEEDMARVMVDVEIDVADVVSQMLDACVAETVDDVLEEYVLLSLLSAIL